MIIACKTCKYSYTNNKLDKPCTFHSTVYDGLKFCVNREYHDWEQYIPENDEFINEKEMKL